MKKCGLCKETKPFEAFHKNKTEKDGRGTRCSNCVKLHRKNNYSKYKAYKRATHLRSVYGLTVEKYEEMFSKQNGKCKICNGISTDPRKNALCVDHNHTTGEIRGLLCDTCNRALGMLKDNVNIIKNAVSYLESYESSGS